MSDNFDLRWRDNRSSCNCDHDRDRDRDGDRREDRREDRRDDRRDRRDRNDYWPWR